jgi:hypothetical protein
VSTTTILWLPWMVALSTVAAWLALRAWRRGDSAAALGWSGWAMVPPALLLTSSMVLVARIADAVTSWAANLVFNPVTWVGVIVGGVAVLMIGGAAALRRRRGPAPVDASRSKAVRRSSSTAPAGSDSNRAKTSPVDDDMAEIEEILRRRGIG